MSGICGGTDFIFSPVKEFIVKFQRNTIIFFYTYSGILGKNIAFIDISLFFMATILGEYVAYRFITNTVKCNKKISIFVLILIGICFITFTYSTPKLGIFKDPITYQYSIIKN